MNRFQKNAAKARRILRKYGPPFRLKDGTYGNCRKDGTVGSGCALTAIAYMLGERNLVNEEIGKVDYRKVNNSCQRLLGSGAVSYVIEAFDARINESAGEFELFAKIKNHASRLDAILTNIIKYGRVIPSARQRKKAVCLS
jgi:hypothetical protein